MGAMPGHTTITPPSAPVFLPTLPPQMAEQDQEQKPSESKPSTKPRAYQVGEASWYGDMFQGKATASGEDYDMHDFTAAHRELPLGTLVKVTNLSNHKTVVVRVNDRGPMTPGRIIDLSYGAACRIGMHQNGLQKVRIDIVKPQEAELAMAANRP